MSTGKKPYSRLRLKISLAAVFLLLTLSVTVWAAGEGRIPLERGAERDVAVILLITFVLLALGFSFMCSVAEAVLLSITPSYIESQKDNRPRWAERLRRVRQDNVDRSLAAILTMNTIAHTVGAMEAGAQATVVFGSAWVGLFSAVLTLMILFFSEIIPKTLGAVYWPRLVKPTVLYIRILTISLYPLVTASEWLTKLIAQEQDIHRFSRDEFLAMAGIGQETGDIDLQEWRIIHNLFRFRYLTAADIMTPRTVITALPEEMSVTEAQKTAIKTSFSRLPVYGADIDDIKGFVLKNEILLHDTPMGKKLKLKELKREIQPVPEIMSLPALLEFLLDHRQHIALVVDEFGGTAGVTTLEDVMETLLGMEIVDEWDNVTDMQVLARKQWERRIESLGIELPDS